jgi:hypothetical protein
MSGIVGTSSQLIAPPICANLTFLFAALSDFATISFGYLTYQVLCFQLSAQVLGLAGITGAAAARAARETSINI